MSRGSLLPLSGGITIEEQGCSELGWVVPGETSSFAFPLIELAPQFIFIPTPTPFRGGYTTQTQQPNGKNYRSEKYLLSAHDYYIKEWLRPRSV